MKILEIDDNSDIVKFIEMAVSTMGHEFSYTLSGREGLKMIEENLYDLVLLDMSMPEFSGLDVIDALEEKGLLSKQKIVIFTASSGVEQDLVDLVKRGVHSYLAKPVDLETLEAKLKEIESG